ncbi:MAG: DUF1150 family protein [Pseudomonadota bacterium]
MTEEFSSEMESNIVYVREAEPEQLPDEVRNVPGKIFSIHDESGKILALARDRSMAFAVARNNDMTPVSVH